MHAYIHTHICSNRKAEAYEIRIFLCTYTHTYIHTGRQKRLRYVYPYVHNTYIHTYINAHTNRKAEAELLKYIKKEGMAKYAHILSP
jgi:hypothetical protein